MDYRVTIVPDYALPSDVKRVMVEKHGRDPVLVIAESVAGNWRFLQEWEQDYQNQDDEFCLRAV
jgi:hypothetical protein